MKNRIAQVLLLSLIGIALFWQLGSHGLTEPDEGRTAGIGLEFAQSGTWLIPRLYDLAQFNKPPLVYWACAVSYKLFGDNEWAARLPAALAALGTLLLTRAITRRLYGDREAMAATLILLTAPMFFVMAHIIDPNMMLTFWLTLTMWAAVAWFQDAKKSQQWIFYTGLALAFLTKGPPALGVIGLALAGFRFISFKRDTVPSPSLPSSGERDGVRGLSAVQPLAFRSLLNLPAILLCVALSLGWFIAVATKYPELWNFFLGQELVGRLSGKIAGRAQPFWYFIPLLIGGFLPWVPLLIAALIAAVKKFRTDSRERFLLLWIALPFLMFSASKSKLPAYVLPLFPPLAIVVGAHAAEFAQKHWLRLTQILFALLVAAALPLSLAMGGPNEFGWDGTTGLTDLKSQAFWLGPAIAALVAIYVLRKNRKLIAVSALLAFAYLATLGIISRHQSEVGPYSSPKTMCAALKPLLQSGDRVVIYKNAPRGVNFYLQHPLSFSDKYEPQLVSDWELLADRLYKEDDLGIVYRWVDHEPRVFVITTDRKRGGVAGQDKSPLDFLRDGCRKPLREIYRDDKYVVVCNFPE